VPDPLRLLRADSQRPAYRCATDKVSSITAIKVRKDSTFLTSGEQWCNAIAMIVAAIRQAKTQME